MAKLTRNSALDATITIECTVRELLTAVRSMGYQIEHDDNVTTWSIEADQYDDWRKVLEEAMQDLAHSTSEVKTYHIPEYDAKSRINSRKAKDAA